MLSLITVACLLSLIALRLPLAPQGPPAALLLSQQPGALPTTLSGWCCAFALALTVNVGAVVLFQQGTFLVGGERASILSTFEPITGVLLGVLVFRETVGARTLLGTCLVLLAAVCIAAWDMRKTK